MLNPIILLFVSGAALFTGVGITLAAGFFPVLSARPRLRMVANIGMLLGVAVALMSANPLPGWAYGAWCGAVAALFMLFNHKERPAAFRLRFAYILLVLFSALLCALEMPWQIGRAIPFPTEGTLSVVGDSLSIGADARELNWPERLGALAGLPVQNLGFGGATVSSALSNAERVATGATIVVLEIGGNDILNGTESRAFAEKLDAMLDTVCQPGRCVVMLELPLPPSFNRFGYIQRRLAKKYGVVLVPKRVLAGVIFQEGTTTDGLHLSHAGHELLAQALWARRVEGTVLARTRAGAVPSIRLARTRAGAVPSMRRARTRAGAVPSIRRARTRAGAVPSMPSSRHFNPAHRSRRRSE